MITVFLVSLGLALIAFLLSGARRLVYLLYFLAYVPFLSLDPEGAGLSDLSGLERVDVRLKMGVRLATAGACLLLLARRRGALLQLFQPASLPIVFFVLWSATGTLQNPSPGVPLLRLGELFSFYLMGMCLLLTADRYQAPRRVLRWHCLGLWPLCLAALCFAATHPTLAYHLGPGGLRLGHRMLDATSLGFAAALILLWSTHELRQPREGERHRGLERLMPLLALGTAFAVLVYARSRGAMIAAFVGQLVLWWPLRRDDSRSRTLFVLASVGAVCVTIAGSGMIADWFLRGDGVANLLSGTGRTSLWAGLLDEVPRAPLLGAGYLSLSSEGFFEHGGVRWTNAHNTFLFALVSTGIPGLAAVVAIALLPAWAALRKALSAPANEQADWMLLLAAQVTLLVTAIAGYGVLGYPNPAMLFAYAIYPFSVARRPAVYRPRKARRSASFAAPAPTPAPRGVAR